MDRLKTYWSGQAEWWRSRSLEWWAAHLTAFYVGGAIVIMGAKFEDLLLLKLNEIGDLAAGAFGPVAFLWLVLGYLQQGKELRVSSEALRMQAEEMKALVTQQVAIVETHNLNLLNHETSLEPLLDLKYGGAGNVQGKTYYRFTLDNSGHYCEHVFKKLMVDGEEKNSERLSSLSRDSSTKISLSDELEVGVEYELRFYYKRTSGNVGFQGFMLVRYQRNGNEGISVIKKPYKTEISTSTEFPDFMLL